MRILKKSRFLKFFFPFYNKFEAQEHDVFLVSFPRSGSTWIRYILANIFMPNNDWNIENISKVIPDIHQKSPVDLIQFHPRILKSHFPYGVTPYKKVIYLYRDGRDVAVSYFHYCKKLRGYNKPFDIFLSEFLNGDMPYGAWHSHINSMVFSKYPLIIHPVSYENMVLQPHVEISNIGDFLGFSWNSNLIDSAVHKSSFSKIKQDYKEFKYTSHWSKGFEGGVQGGPGKWKVFFTPEQNIRFWNISGETSSRLGYKIDSSEKWELTE